MFNAVAGWTCPRCSKSLRLNEPTCPNDGLSVALGFEPRALAGCRISETLVLTEFVATGGFAHVYFAQHAETHGARVVKLLRPEFAIDSDTVQRFRQEARVAESLEHPHIVRMYDAGLVDGVPFLVMERIRGDSVRTLVEREGPIPPERVSRWIAHVAEALDFAHENDVIHRDLTASNIIVRDAGQLTESATVIDFGLAKALGAANAGGLTAKNEAVGTPAYMSPEQFGLGRVDRRSDVFALAVVATYALFKALPPRAGEIPDGTADDPYGIDTLTLTPGLPPDVRRVLKGGMNPAMLARYRTAGIFANELRAAIAGGRKGGPRRSRRPTWPLRRVAATTVIIGGGAWLALANSLGGSPALPGLRSSNGPDSLSPASQPNVAATPGVTSKREESRPPGEDAPPNDTSKEKQETPAVSAPLREGGTNQALDPPEGRRSAARNPDAPPSGRQPSPYEQDRMFEEAGITVGGHMEIFGADGPEAPESQRVLRAVFPAPGRSRVFVALEYRFQQGGKRVDWPDWDRMARVVPEITSLANIRTFRRACVLSSALLPSPLDLPDPDEDRKQRFGRGAAIRTRFVAEIPVDRLRNEGVTRGRITCSIDGSVVASDTILLREPGGNVSPPSTRLLGADVMATETTARIRETNGDPGTLTISRSGEYALADKQVLLTVSFELSSNATLMQHLQRAPSTTAGAGRAVIDLPADAMPVCILRHRMNGRAVELAKTRRVVRSSVPRGSSEPVRLDLEFGGIKLGRGGTHEITCDDRAVPPVAQLYFVSFTAQ